jgi:hypothetical protein
VLLRSGDAFPSSQYFSIGLFISFIGFELAIAKLERQPFCGQFAKPSANLSVSYDLEDSAGDM